MDQIQRMEPSMNSGERVMGTTTGHPTDPAAAGKVRLYEVAKDLGLANKDLVAKVRALGVTSVARDPELPDVPTIAESGMPGFEVISWQGLCTPTGVPKERLARIRAALGTALAQPDTRKRLADSNFHPHPLTPEKFAAFIRSERTKWSKLVKDVGIEPQ